MSNNVIIVAAGEGIRFGHVKQFYSFQGRPLLLYALDPFENSEEINKITIVVPNNKIAYTKGLVKKWRYKKIRYIISGGKRRQDSVLNGLKTITEKTGIVVIHDGIRPIVLTNMVKKGIKLCRKYKAVIPGIPIYDTIKQVNKNFVVSTIPRRSLYLIQTPQFYEINLIKNAYKKANLSIDYTDEAAILESLRLPVYLFQGDRLNIKITEKTDLKILNKFLS